MGTSAERGTVLLTLAQVWHALSGYVIFFTGGRILGLEDYGDFALVVWTMTTLEVFVVDGVPRAVSFYVAKLPGGAWLITRRGVLLTSLVAAVLAGALAVLAPAVAALWDDPELVRPLRLSALDFLAFVGFAVLVQAINGLHDFGRQAVIWLVYSTCKVGCVVAFLAMGFGIEGGVLGFVAGSLLGSIAAACGGLGRIRRAKDRADVSSRALWEFGLPFSTQALALMALVNVDLWAAKATADGDDATVGAYTAAATLGRALFFIFKAFGDALFPAVSRAIGAGDVTEARRVARKSLAMLMCLLIPAAGLASGSARPVLTTLYDDAAFGAGAGFLHVLAPAAAAWTLTAVLAALMAAASRPWRAAGFLAVLLAIETAAVFVLADAHGAMGAAWGALGTGGLGLLVAASLVRDPLRDVVALKALFGAAAGGVLLHLALGAWAPAGWLVFPYGALLFAVVVSGLRGARCF